MTALACGGVRKTYGAFVALDDVAMTVDAGEILGLARPHRAGKTTRVEGVWGGGGWLLLGTIGRSGIAGVVAQQLKRPISGAGRRVRARAQGVGVERVMVFLRGGGGRAGRRRRRSPAAGR